MVLENRVRGGRSGKDLRPHLQHGAQQWLVSRELVLVLVFRPLLEPPSRVTVVRPLREYHGYQGVRRRENEQGARE